MREFIMSWVTLTAMFIVSCGTRMLMEPHETSCGTSIRLLIANCGMSIGIITMARTVSTAGKSVLLSY
jgi:hypothetical protein